MIKIGNFLFRYRNGVFPVFGLLLFINPRPLLASDNLAAVLGFVAGLAGMVLRGVTVGLEYIKRGGLNRQVYADKLVQGGMFAHCRNPLYVGNLLGIVGLGLVANSLLFLTVAVPFFIFAYLAIVAAEENFLRHKFGAEFEDYCRRVGRFTLNLSGFRHTWCSMVFRWQRVIVKEYGSIFTWIATACLLMAKQHWPENNPLGAAAVRFWSGALLGSVVIYGVTRYLKKRRLLQAD